MSLGTTVADNDCHQEQLSAMMNHVYNSTDLLPLNFPPSLVSPPLLLLKNPNFVNFRFHKTITPLKSHSQSKPPKCRITCCSTDHTSSASMADIDMTRNKDGVWTAKPKKVVVLWDLDNKPPRGPPYQAAMALKQIALRFGDSLNISAYANRHAFDHLPDWVRQERRERHQMDVLERKGLSIPSDPYVCGVCGRKCKTNLDLKKHFKQLHERERQKKLNRMRSLKGKKRQKYKERFVSGNHKYEEAARTLLKPKSGYGLASELRRAGVFVKMVDDKPQAADWAVKRQMQHSMSCGVDWLFLVSDDSDFSDMLRRARESNLRTVVVGDRDRALGRHADFWVPWSGVENGQIGEEDLLNGKHREEYSDRDDDGELFSFADFDEDNDDEDNDDDDDDEDDDGDDDYYDDDDDDYEDDLDRVMDEFGVTSSRSNGIRVSAFSEGEEGDY